MTESILQLADLQAMTSKERYDLSEDELARIIFRSELDDGPENRSVLSKMLVWYRQEILAMFSDPLIKVDQEVSADKLRKRLLSFQESAIELEDLCKILVHYSADIFALRESAHNVLRQGDSAAEKEKILARLETYLNGFITDFDAYLTRRKLRQPEIAVKFPLDVATLPLDIGKLDDESISLAQTFFHDLGNVIQLVTGNIHYYSAAIHTIEGKEHDFMYEIQGYIEALQDFFLGFDLHNLRYSFDPSPLPFTLESFRNKMKKDIPLHKPIHDVNYTFVSEPNASLENALGPEAKAHLYNTKLSSPFLVRLVQNIKQNVERVNASLAADKRLDEVITRVSGKVFYQTRPVDKLDVQDERQVVDNGRAVWLVLEVTDDGPGFPSQESDEMVELDGQTVRLYLPEEGKSSHGGKGIGLRRMQKDVFDAGGELIMYTPVASGGATIRVAFPLLNRS